MRFPDRGRLTVGWVAQMSELKSISDESVPSVPNGTATTAELEALVVRYNGYAKKSVQGFLGLAETLLEAKANFPDQLTEFCRKVGLEREGSKFRKLVAIGEAAPRLEPLIDRMPNKWTTVYRLACLEQREFRLLTQHDRFSPRMTSAEMDLILGGPAKNTADCFSKDIFIDLSGVDQKRELWSRLQDLETEFGCRCKFRKSVAKEIEPNGAPTQQQELALLDAAIPNI